MLYFIILFEKNFILLINFNDYKYTVDILVYEYF